MAEPSAGVHAEPLPRGREAAPARGRGPWALAARRFARDKAAVGFAVLFAAIVVAAFGAPLYAGEVAHTTPAENHLTDRTVVDGQPMDVVSLEGIPIGPTGQREYFLGADDNGATSPSGSSTA